MEMIVADASVAAKWYVVEQHTPAAMRLLHPRYEIHAPDLLFIEMDNVLCTWMRAGGIDHATADTIRTALRSVPINLHPSLPLLDTAYVIASDTHTSVYDALYVALAAHLKAKVVTADRRLLDALAATPFSKQVVWVADLT